MANPNEFLAQLKNFDKDHLPLNVWKKLRDQYMRNPDCTYEILLSKSAACAGIFNWIKGIYLYCGITLGQDVTIEYYEREFAQANQSPKKKRPTTSPTKKRSAKPKEQMAAP